MTFDPFPLKFISLPRQLKIQMGLPAHTPSLWCAGNAETLGKSLRHVWDQSNSVCMGQHIFHGEEANLQHVQRNEILFELDSTWLINICLTSSKWKGWGWGGGGGRGRMVGGLQTSFTHAYIFVAQIFYDISWYCFTHQQCFTCIVRMLILIITEG